MPPESPCIRIVDDDPRRLGLCRQVLEAAGYITREGGPSTPDDAAVLVAEHLVDRVPGREAHGIIVLTDEPGAHLLDERALAWVRVPVEPGALLRAVEDFLDARGER